MNKAMHLFIFLLLFASINSCSSAQQEEIQKTNTPTSIPSTATSTASHPCTPTFDDGVSPSYKPDTPVRTVVGHGHVVTGTVRSSVDCSPIPNAKLEFWPEEGDLGHPDSSSATFFTDENGQYRFECNPPEHIHMRISADGFQTIGVNSYHPDGAVEGIFDIVLKPAQ